MKAVSKYCRSIFTGLLLLAATVLFAQPTLRLSPEYIVAIPGQEIEVDVVMDGFTDLAGFYIPLSWDPEVLEFVKVSNINSGDFLEYNSNLFITPGNVLGPGEMSTVWTHPQDLGISVPDNTVVFTLTLRAINGGAARVAFEGDPGLVLLDAQENLIAADQTSTTGTVFGSCRERDSLGLVELYEATNGPGWTNSWDLNAPMDTWEGVTLSGEGCVVELDLEENNLSGALPDLKLPNLEKLNLQRNFLNGPLPAFSNTVNLIEINLSVARLQGMIPDFNNIPTLESLNLGVNQLNGPIPDFSNLPNLTSLDLSFNDLSGPIPDFSNLPNLTSLDLSSIDLSGAIPVFSNLPNLTSLDLNFNDLSGAIPDFSNLPNLTSLDLNFNDLSGAIPDFDHLQKLEKIDFGRNQLSGTIPDFSNLPNLIWLDLGENQLTGGIPDFSNLPNLIWLDLGENQLTGEVPDFSNLPSLSSLYLSDNQLSGTIPNFNNLPRLRALRVSNNRLSGQLPDFNNLSNLRLLSVENNRLTGLLPNLSDNLPLLRNLDVQKNKYTFIHLLPNLTANETLIITNAFFESDTLAYAPQSPIYPDTNFTPTTGQPFTIDLGIDADVTTNVYTWYKDGNPFRTITGNNQLTFDPLTAGDAGVYKVEVTNPGAPELTLESGNIAIEPAQTSSSVRLILLDEKPIRCITDNTVLIGVLPNPGKTLVSLELYWEDEQVDPVVLLPGDDLNLAHTYDLSELAGKCEYDCQSENGFCRRIAVIANYEGGVEVRENNSLLLTFKKVPEPDFEIDSAVPPNNNSISFINTTCPSNDEDLGFQWDFGDGKMSNEEQPTQIYEAPGAYDVQLTATSEFCGTEAVTKTIQVNPPQIRLIAGEVSGNPGEEVLLPILAENADGLAALQGKISLQKPDVAEMLGIQPARIQPVFNAANGQFTFFDETGQGLALQPLDTLFYLQLRLTGARGSISDVFFENGENLTLSAHLFDGDIVEAAIETIDGLVTILDAVPVSGRITLFNDRPVAGVTVTARIDQPNGASIEQQQVTDAAGNYRFAEVPLGSRVNLEPVRSGDAAAFVSSSGLLYAVQAFLDGNVVPMITSPLQLAAGDVNCDGQLNTADLLLLQEVMTGLQPALPGCPVWTFTPESYLPDFQMDTRYFPNLPVPGSYTIDNLSGEGTINFKGFKTGDLTGEAQTP